MGYYTREKVIRLIHDGAAKCRVNIELARNDDEMDGAISLCNAYSGSIVSILNNEDYGFISRKFNVHRKWCQHAFEALQAAVTDLDNYITERKEQMSKDTVLDGKIGFNA